MDYNGNELPLGFGMALMMNEKARAGFEGLSETEKEHIILKCKDAKSRAEISMRISTAGNFFIVATPLFDTSIITHFLTNFNSQKKDGEKFSVLLR